MTVSASDIIAASRTATQAVMLAEQQNPKLAAALQEKGAVFSKTNLGAPIVMLAPYFLAKYGITLSPEETAALTGVMGTIYIWVMGFFRDGTITSVFGRKQVMDMSPTPPPSLAGAGLYETCAHGAMLDNQNVTLPDIMDAVVQRMVKVYGENEQLDYLIALKTRAQKLRDAMATYEKENPHA